MQRQMVCILGLAGLAVLAACRSAGPIGTAQPGASGSTAVVSANARAVERQRWLEMFARGYFPGRSGQVFFVPHEGDFLVDKDPLYVFMHGSPWSYDTDIPLILHGPGFIRRGTYPDSAVQQDIVPTLATLLRVAPPATISGRALRSAIEPAAARRPGVIAVFVLDGMRRDYLDTYTGVLPTLTRLRREGAWFPAMQATAMPTATSLGHATIGTGTDPQVHGLVVNRLFNRVSGASQESYNNLDPGELMALTLADVWNIATEGRAAIIGQGGAIRAAAGLVGHGGCVINGRKVAAASYAARGAGEWETNPDCYTMPAVLATMTAERYWKEAGGTWMGHDVASAARFRASALFQKFEGDALAAVLEAAPLGTDEVTDLVLVNFKGPDYTGHAYGPASREISETLAELDRQLTRALQILERKAGANETVVAITADHGMPGEPPQGRRRLQTFAIAEAINRKFSPVPPNVVQSFSDSANAQIHLDTSRLQALGFTLRDVVTFLEATFFAAAYTEDEVRDAQARLRSPR